MMKSSDLGCKLEAFQIKSEGLEDHTDTDEVSFGLNEDCLPRINLHFQVAVLYGIDNVTLHNHFLTIMQDYTFLIAYK